LFTAIPIPLIEPARQGLSLIFRSSVNSFHFPLSCFFMLWTTFCAAY